VEGSTSSKMGGGEKTLHIEWKPVT
jgi:hypothetical protein